MGQAERREDMSVMLSLKRHLYLRRVGIIFIAVVLISGVVGCDGTTPAEYDLTMAASPAAGGTATDETGTSPYAEDTEVSIKAVANAGYEFDSWTAPAGTFADANAAETTFTMPAQDVTVTANFVLVYDLTMAANPAAGGTATDEIGTSPYAEDTDVSIKAVANAGYEFAGWTAPAGAFADENAATTTFTMPAQDVTITANFEVTSLDHFKVYEYDYLIPPYVGEDVYLEDQFCALNATVGFASHFASPAEKVHGDVTTPILYPDHHFMVYLLDYEADYRRWEVTVSNQFGDNQTLLVEGPVSLVVPTPLEGGAEPVGLDHYMLYEVVESDYDEEEVITVSLKDDLINEPAVYDVYQPVYFVNPVRKTHDGEVTEILHPDVHAVIYRVWSEGEQLETTVHVNNQFGPLDFDIYQDEYARLAVPSQKIAWEPIPEFDHFWMYQVDIGTQPYIGEYVQLQDQFLPEPLDALVEAGAGFCNPVDKYHAAVEWPIYHPEYHLMVYTLDYEEDYQLYEVTVDNQFGEGQVLWVFGPVALAVPTEKTYPDDYGWPEGLDHFLLYQVADSAGPVGELVELWDQFTWEEIWINQPDYFANPVQKTYLGEVTEIEHPDWHMVFYDAVSTPFDPSVEVGILNQFGPQIFTVPYAISMGVPSQKVDWEPLGPYLP